MGDSEGQESLACCSLCDWKESDTTEQLNSNNKDRHRAEEKELEQTGCVSRAEGSLEALSSAVCSQRLWWCPRQPLWLCSQRVSSVQSLPDLPQAWSVSQHWLPSRSPHLTTGDVLVLACSGIVPSLKYAGD